MITSIHLARHHIQILLNASNQYFHGIFQSEHLESLKHILQIETSQIETAIAKHVANCRARGVKLYKQETVQTYDL